MKTQISVSRVPFIWVYTEPVSVPLERLLATWPQKSVVNIPALKKIIEIMMNNTSGMILKKVPIVLIKVAVSTPLLTRRVKTQQKIMATMIDVRFCPLLKTGKKVPKALISMVAKAMLPNQADNQ